MGAAAGRGSWCVISAERFVPSAKPPHPPGQGSARRERCHNRRGLGPRRKGDGRRSEAVRRWASLQRLSSEGGLWLDETGA